MKLGGQQEGEVQKVLRRRRWTPPVTISAIGRSSKEHPDEEDGDQLEDAEGNELEEPVQAQNGLAPFGAPGGGVCDKSDWHGGVGLERVVPLRVDAMMVEMRREL